MLAFGAGDSGSNPLGARSPVPSCRNLFRRDASLKQAKGNGVPTPYGGPGTSDPMAGPIGPQKFSTLPGALTGWFYRPDELLVTGTSGGRLYAEPGSEGIGASRSTP